MAALVAILFLCLTPAKPNVLHLFTFFDKIVHFSLYCFLVVLNRWECRSRAYYKLSRTQFFTRLLIFLFFYGLTIEYLQDWMALGREYDIWDMAANMLGALSGVFISTRIPYLRD